MKRIIIIRPDGIGDFVIFSAVLEKYKELYPEYKIDLLCHPYVKDLAQCVPFIDRIFCIDRDKFLRKRSLVYALVSLIKFMQYKYDEVIYPVYSRTMRYDLIAILIKAKKKVAFSKNNFSGSNNKRDKENKYFTNIIEGEKQEKLEIERNVEFVNKLGANFGEDTVKPKIWFCDKDDAEFQRISKEYTIARKMYIAISPGAGNQVRYWQSEKWVELIKLITGKYPKYKIALLGYGKDIIPIDGILEMLDGRNKGKVVNLYGKTRMRILAKIIQNAKLFIGTESGAVHIAAAVGTPNICLMGGGYFGRFYPYGDLSKNRIVYKKMDCYGCEWRCKYDTPKCIKEISVDNVWKEVIRFLP